MESHSAMSDLNNIFDEREMAKISDEISGYVVANNPSRYSVDDLPRDVSLVEIGVLDSAGVIELIVFVEEKWNIQISDEDITKEKMGSVNKLSALVLDYLSKQR